MFHSCSHSNETMICERAQKLRARLSLICFLHISNWYLAAGQPCTKLCSLLVQHKVQQAA